MLRHTLCALLPLVAGGCAISSQLAIVAPRALDVQKVENYAQEALEYVAAVSEVPPDFSIEGEQSTQPASTPSARAKDPPCPDALALLRAMHARYPLLEELGVKGCLGQDARGYAELEPCLHLKDADAKNSAQKLLYEENTDRKQLSIWIVEHAADAGLTLTQVERIFAAKRGELSGDTQAKPGT
jgi:hypothetical protein